MPTVYVGIGSNIDRERSVRGGVSDLQGHFGEVKLSTVYESEAVGFDGNAFYNLVATFVTEEDIDTVVNILSKIEDEHGRVRNGERFAPRTLDIDLLLYGDAIVKTAQYHVPRDEIPRYAFVLWPLSELAPELEHPETGENYFTMWEQFDKRNQSLLPIPFKW